MIAEAEKWRALQDEACRFYLGISREEFLSRYTAGEYWMALMDDWPGAPWEVVSLFSDEELGDEQS